MRLIPCCLVALATLSLHCSSDSDDGPGPVAGGAGSSGSSGGTGGAGASYGGSGYAGTTAGTAGAGAAGASAGSGGSSGASAAGSAGASGGAGTAGSGGAGGAAGQADFWAAGDIPKAKNVLMFRFLNRTMGRFKDSEVYWRFEHGDTKELHSIAEQPTYDMIANASGRMYFFICAEGDAKCASDPSKSDYFDFIEHTIGTDQYNGNTTRVDAFGLKIAMRLHSAAGDDVTVGEDEATFAETREATFAKFLAESPAEFAPCAKAPFRIVEPGACGFNKDGANAHYYDAFVDEMWANNGITIPKPGPNGSGLAAYPDLSAAIFRHVGAAAGTFDAAGKRLDKDLWKDPSTFYTAAPANYYARFWHKHSIDGRAYGFPYDDVGSYSTYVSRKNPEYLLIAIGF